jgi:hypothetical protein
VRSVLGTDRDRDDRLGASYAGAVQEIADRLRGNGYDVTRLDLLDRLP